MTATTEKPAVTPPTKLPQQYGVAVRQKFERHAETPPPADGQAQRRVYRIEISNETPFERYGMVWILGHKKSEIDLSYAENGLTFWLEHGGQGAPENPDPSLHLGIVSNFSIENGGLWGDAEFADDAALSPQALAVKRDWESSSATRRFISVCQKPIDYVLKTATAQGEMSQQRWTRWQPREVSIVGVPAIPNTGRHSATGEEFEVRNVTAAPPLEPPPGEQEPKEHEEQEPKELEPITTEEATEMSPTATPPSAPAKTGVEVGTDHVKAREAEITEIQELCESFGLERAAERDMIRRGLSIDAARKEVLAKLSTDHVRTPSSESLETLGVSKKDLKKYRYSDAIAQALAKQNSGDYDGIVGEIHKGLLRSKPENMATHGGIFVPWDTRTEAQIAEWEERQLARHTMATNQPAKGLELVGQQTMPLIELLQAMPVAAQLGAVQNFGLTQPLSYPRVTGGPTVYFQGENPSADVTTSDLVTGEILSNGRQTIGAIPLSRALALQTGGSAEAYAKRLLVEGESLVVDRAFFGGTGSGAQPLGLYNVPTVQTVAMGSVTPTYDKITQMLAKVNRANADLGSLGFVTTPEIAAKLMITPEISAASAKPIWTGTMQNGQIAGYRAIASSQAPNTLGAGGDEHCFGYGNWGSAHINRWGAVEVLVNPYTQALRALLMLITYGMADTVLTQPQGMCVGTAAKPA